MAITYNITASNEISSNSIATTFADANSTATTAFTVQGLKDLQKILADTTASSTPSAFTYPSMPLTYTPSNFDSGSTPTTTATYDYRCDFSTGSDGTVAGSVVYSCSDYAYTPSEIESLYIGPVERDKKDILKEKIKDNLHIRTKSRTRLIQNVPENEQVAIETLREMITEAEFRRFLKDGFILVKGNSGKVYQVFRSSYHTIVWHKGKIIEEVCVRIKDKNIPLTDNLIAFKTLIEVDEEEFKKLGNVYNMVA